MSLRRIADYTIVRERDRGGMGVVYQALSPAGATVALKTVTWPQQPDARKRWEAIERFQREARAARALSHPNICQVLDYGADESSLFIVMEFLDGQSLRELIRSAGAIRVERAVEIAVAVCEALAYAHEHGVIHRDIKPENIMLLRSGEVKLTDFGLASLVSEATLADAGAVAGTLCYMSPEQVRGEGAQVCSDLFSFGATFYEMLTGTRAFSAEEPATIIHKILHVEPPPMAGLPEGVAETLRRCLRKQPQARFQSARQVADALLSRAPGPGPEVTLPLPRLDLAPRVMTPSPTPSAPLPLIWNVPHRRNPNFTGREELLAGVESALARGGQAALTQAIVGLGGIGKTQLALEYAYRHAGDYQVIWWVRSEEPTQLAADYAALAGPLDLPEKAASDQSAAIDAVRRWLERKAGWLLILDNVPAPEAVLDYLPQGGGHVLLTSRDQNWGRVAAPVSVPVLPQEEAVALLGKRTGWTGPEVGVLAEELGQLPLALEQAAAYAAATGCRVTTYLDLFRFRRQALLQRARPPEGYQGTVTSTWSLAMAEAAAECPAAAGLLTLCAYLAPDGIPLSLVQEGVEHLPEPLGEAARDPLLLHDAVAALRRYSLVSVHQEALSVHRLVQAVVRDGLAEEEQRQWAAAAVRSVFARFPKAPGQLYDASLWPACILRLPHALAAASLALPLARPDFAEDLTWLLSCIGRYLETLAQYEQARACVTNALDCAERTLRPDHPGLIRLLHHASDLSDNPRPLRERALAIAEERDDESVPWLLLGLARALCHEGDDAGAKAACERALATAERTQGRESQLATEMCHRLAYLQMRLGDFASAKRGAEWAAAALEKCLPPEARPRAWGPLFLAYVLAHVGDLSGERREWERALEIAEQVFEPGNTRMALALFPVGLYARLGAGDLAGAKAHLERAHQVLGQASGWEHPLTGAILSGLVQVAQLSGDPAAARPLAEQILAVAEKRQKSGRQAASFGAQGWELADFFCATVIGLRLSARGALNQLASVRLDLGDLEAAQSHLERALTMADVFYGEWSGPDYEGVAEVLPNLGRLRRLQGRLEEAKACLERSLATPEHLGPPHQWRMAATHLEYGLTLQEMGDVSGAREHLTQAVAMFEHRLGPQHPRSENARRCLAALDAAGG